LLNGEPDPEPFDGFFDDLDADFDKQPAHKIQVEAIKVPKE
jgi:hypothetical protein